MLSRDERIRRAVDHEYKLQEMERNRIRKQAERDRRRRRIELIFDPISYLVLTVALLAIVTLDSDSWVPAIALGVSVVYLAIYGAWRGVLR